MLFVCQRHVFAATALLLFCSIPSQTSATAINPVSHASGPTCEFRTINYITASLPQQCGKSSWSNSNTTAATQPVPLDGASSTGGQYNVSAVVSTSDSSKQEAIKTAAPTAAPTAEATSIDSASSVAGDAISSTLISLALLESATPKTQSEELEGGELDGASFMSFEEWKKQTLEKSGQQNPNIGNKRSSEKKKDSEGIQNHLDSLGEEGEFDLDFSAFTSGGQGDEKLPSHETKEASDRKNMAMDKGHSDNQYRSKDAGKTCKERFSYASFDAGATIVKTHPGAKNSKAVLIENKDSYMLSECKIENKFLIIELSEDIWIDTLVLANYEFFSSMIRTFRVSVSDRFPVKPDKWKDLGIHEARNSREVQAFLIENPQIWARYIRVEFLTHYGNEYYCPLSLVRVHGTRMLESWKETEANGDEEDAEAENQSSDEFLAREAVADAVKEKERVNAELEEATLATAELGKIAERYVADGKGISGVISSEQATSSWVQPRLHNLPKLFESTGPDLCFKEEAPTTKSATLPATESSVRSNTTSASGHTTSTTFMTSTAPSSGTSASPHPSSASKSAQPQVTAKPATTNSSSGASNISDTTKAISNTQDSTTLQSISVPSKQPNSTAQQKGKVTGTSSAISALPTIQENFFKAATRRLQLLETNSTLSLKYIEEQSKMLREAFSKVEKKQLQKTTTFLETLNTTVLAELRGFRQQYDEIWQSTVISLEGQREESRREILAISARLTILADEVVFQKRMSIVQSVLLLLCLGLVIFSRVSAAGSFDMPTIPGTARAFGFPRSPLGSPPESPEYYRTNSMRQRGEWLTANGRVSSEGYLISPSDADEYSPPTPVSPYSSGIDHTPPSGTDEVGRPTNHIEESASGYVESSSIQSQPQTVRRRSAIWDGSSETQAPERPVSQSRPPTARTNSGTWAEDSLSQKSDTPISPIPPIRTPRKRKAFIRQFSSSPSFNNSDNEPFFGSPPEPTHTRTSSLPFLPSPRFSIARKPLPALPPTGV